MKRKIFPAFLLLTFFLLFCLSSCKKEDEPVKPTTSYDMLKSLYIGCKDTTTNSQFDGVLDMDPLCLHDLPDTFKVGLGGTQVTNSGTINTGSGFRPTLFWSFDTKDANWDIYYQFSFFYRGTDFQGQDIGGFLDAYFPEGEYIKLSEATAHDSLPTLEQFRGFSVQIFTAQQKPGTSEYTYSGPSYITDCIIQPSQSYVKCLKREDVVVDGRPGYRVVLDMNLVIANSRWVGQPGHISRNLKGQLTVQMLL